MTVSPTERLAIVVKGWPRLSETFIAQELVALQEAGLEFEIWSLRYPTDAKRHPLHDRLTVPVRYLPEYLYEDPQRLQAAKTKAKTLPGYDTAYKIWRADLRRDPSHNRIRRFGQACVLASELPTSTRGLYAHFLHTPASVTRYAAIMRELPWSFSAHAKDIWTSPDWELREKLSPAHKGAQFGVTCTGFGAQHLQDLSSGTPVDLIYHGLDLKRFPTPPTRSIGRHGAPFKILSVGRLVEKKGFDRLLRALALLPDELNWHWTHIGGGTLKDPMQKLAFELGLTEQITWHGACDQPEVIDAMRRSDIFALPSRIAADGDRDGLPNVLMEAASQKLPILSTEVSAIPEFITNGTHGVLSADTPEAFSKAMRDMAQNPEQTQQMAEAAFVRLQNDFNMTPGITRLYQRLNNLLDQPQQVT